MTITHKINDYFIKLFPEAKGDRGKLENSIKKYYTVGPFEPGVQMDGNVVHITIDVDRIEADKEPFDRLVSLADNGKYDEAKELATKLIEQAPNISEYHRILGQIHSETGDQNEAVNSLIDALKWNPKNEWALLMMGNIYARFKDDVETAITFYKQVLKLNPDDHLALNNIGAQLMEAGKTTQAKTYFEKAHAINSEYSNTLHALALIANKEGRTRDAFDRAVEAIKKNPKKDDLYKQSLNLALQSSKRLTDETDADSIIQDYINELTVKTDTVIRLKVDSSINVAATIQYAEVHSRDHHLVLYKPNQPGVEHLILHELTHLSLAHEAREAGKQKLFTSNASNKSTFFMSVKRDLEKIKKRGVPEQKAEKLMESFFSGLNSQIFNAPIDLFIEDRIYQKYKALQPFQFLSLYSIIQKGIEANTRPDIIKIAPSKVLSVSITYNVLSALHYRDLYGADLIEEHNPKKKEVEKARSFYEEYQDYRDDKEPGEEYDLIQFWAEDLHIDQYFELIEEEKQSRSAESVLDSIEDDPYGLNDVDPSKERDMKRFIEKHGGDDVNMAVAMYMVDALNYFKEFPQPKIKKIAFEIAHLGTAGIDPNKDGYHIPSIKGSSFSGYKTLAYYYVSWALAVPEMLSSLQMPFDEEYQLATQLKGK